MVGTIQDHILKIRNDYESTSLRKANMLPHPIDQFGRWMQEAIDAEVKELNLMTLATATKAGKPSARIVLLREFDSNGFVFYTNYKSRKGREIDENPFVSLNIFWAEIGRQIRIEGSIQKVEGLRSDKYFDSRPKESNIGALASAQSEVIENREILEVAAEKLAKQLESSIPKRPDHWGGYIVRPERIEFWQHRQKRLHDRIEYSVENGQWLLRRLAP